MRRDHGLEHETMLASIAARLVRVHPPKAAEPLIIALEESSANKPWFALGYRLPAHFQDWTREKPSRLLDLRDLLSRLEDSEPAAEDQDELFTAILSEWLQFYSPRTLEFVRATLGLDEDRLAPARGGADRCGKARFRTSHRK